MNLYNERVIKQIKYKGLTICKTKSNIWVIGIIIQDDPVPQWAKTIKDAKEIINWMESS